MHSFECEHLLLAPFTALEPWACKHTSEHGGQHDEEHDDAGSAVDVIKCHPFHFDTAVDTIEECSQQ